MNIELFPQTLIQESPEPAITESLVHRILKEYGSLESSIKIHKHLDHVTYESPVNFNESMRQPRHRWFPYKEGFSPSFVRSFISRNKTDRQANILDPFAGVGTTVIESSLAGHAAVGIEVNPLALFIAKTKSISVSAGVINELKDQIQRFELADLEDRAPLPNNETVIKYFEPAYLEALLRVKAFINLLPAGEIHDLFKLAYLNLIEHFSTHRKAGNGLKRKSKFTYRKYAGHPLTQVRTAMLSLLHLFLHDIELVPTVKDVRFLLDTSLELTNLLPGERFDCVLTSPPYANCFDYSKIYLCELWLGDFFSSPESQKDFRLKSIRSHVHATWPERHQNNGSPLMNEVIHPLLVEMDLWSKLIPAMLKGYFMDLGHLFEQLSVSVKSGGSVGFVVSNSVYGGIPIATDLLLTDTAASHGFETESIEIYRRIVPSSQQFLALENKHYLRESLVIFRKA